MANKDSLEFLERITKLADSVRTELIAASDDEARFAIVKGLVDDAEIAFGIWQDAL